MCDDSLSRLQTFAIKKCRDCPLFVEVSGNVLHALAGITSVDGDPLYLCAGDGEWADPDLTPGHECELYDVGPMLAYLVTPR